MVAHPIHADTAIRYLRNSASGGRSFALMHRCARQQRLSMVRSRTDATAISQPDRKVHTSRLVVAIRRTHKQTFATAPTCLNIGRWFRIFCRLAPATFRRAAVGLPITTSGIFIMGRAYAREETVQMVDSLESAPAGRILGRTKPLSVMTQGR